MWYSEMQTPVGPITIVAGARGILRVTLRAAPELRSGQPLVRDDAALAAARAQLDAYFAGERREFDLPLAPDGTPFQQQVWQALRAIPFGETRSYGELARALGEPGAARAVGAANRTNPIAIIVPCHRVIGADGSLTGYAGGIERKKLLLEHESRFASPRQLRLAFAAG